MKELTDGPRHREIQLNMSILCFDGAEGYFFEELILRAKKFEKKNYEETHIFVRKGIKVEYLK